MNEEKELFSSIKQDEEGEKAKRMAVISAVFVAVTGLAVVFSLKLGGIAIGILGALIYLTYKGVKG